MKVRVTRRRVLVAAAVVVALVAGVTTWAVLRGDGTRQAAPCTGPQSPEPAAAHPRLLVRPGDVDRLRSWAVAGNPVYAEGLGRLAEKAKDDMDAGRVPGLDAGRDNYVEYPTESYAELFAFLSLVSPDRASRDDYGRRACALVMDVIRTAARGPGDSDAAFRQPQFATSDRSRWSGEAFGLTVDWAYPYFSAEEKATVRTVFLRWSDELMHAHTTDFNHPEPVGATNDPALLADRTAVRWSLNNYYTSHMRNLGFMALSMDAADDPGGTLHGYLTNAIGAWLYVVDHALRTDAAGGLGPEGFEYGPQSLGYIAQFLRALHTAGQDDPGRLGRQVVMADNPFWGTYVPALLHHLSPATVEASEDLGGGQIYQPAWYGSGLTYVAPDLMESLGPLALDAADRGDRQTVDAARWIATNVGPGGAQRLASRIDDTEEIFRAILYFLALDPAAAAPADPRPGLPLVHYAPGDNRLLARTSWRADAGWFTYSLAWKAVDHQRGDGNNFELYRNGEWLTKQQVGYSAKASDYHNTLTIQNDPPEHNDDADYRHDLSRRGSQWTFDTAGDPVLVGHSVGDGFVYAAGDATNLYNSPYEGSTDVVEASRAVVWLQPDTVVVYDRAETKKENRFKRFWLQLPAEARIDGRQATVKTPKGQQMVVSTLLPAAATLAVEPADRGDDIATGDPIRYRLKVEDPAQPKQVRFLHVVQGADGGAKAAPVSMVAGTAGTPYAGAVVGGTAVLFPHDLRAKVTTVTVTLPGGTSRVLVTGLQPGASYAVTPARTGAGVELTVTAGPSGQRADGGGVLALTL